MDNKRKNLSGFHVFHNAGANRASAKLGKLHDIAAVLEQYNDPKQVPARVGQWHHLCTVTNFGSKQRAESFCWLVLNPPPAVWNKIVQRETCAARQVLKLMQWIQIKYAAKFDQLEVCF